MIFDDLRSRVADLRSRARRAPARGFRLTTEEWHEAIEIYRRVRPIYVKSARRGSWRHPWEIAASWSDEREAFQLAVRPGFVNGDDVETSDGEIIARGGKLTIDPQRMRAIGPDSQPVGSTGDSARRDFSFEPVPQYFAALGVGEAPDLSLSSLGLETTIDITARDPERRLLRAIDVVLTVDRPALIPQVTVGAGVDGSFVQLDASYGLADGARSRPYLTTETRFEPAAELVRTFANLLGEQGDDGRDRLKIATVYLMSPPGAEYGSDPTEAWQPFASNDVFWNLNHALNRIPQRPEDDRLTFLTGLAGGSAELQINTTLAADNDNFDAARDFLAARDIAGRFWTT